MIVFGVFALAVLASLFYWAFYWSGRVEETAYVGVLLGDALYSVELQRRMQLIDERWERRKYHVDAMNDQVWRSAHPYPPPPTKGDNLIIREAIRSLEQQGYIGTAPPGFGSTDEEAAEARDYRLRLIYWANTELENKAKGLRAEAVSKSETDARGASRRALGAVDLATLRGRGPEFVLQFTALVTIVFVVLLLNTVGHLDSEQAGTILAAIAGYVLGQTTTRRDQAGSSVRVRTENEAAAANGGGAGASRTDAAR